MTQKEETISPNFCKDCKWVVIQGFWSSFRGIDPPMCSHPKVLDKVTGKPFGYCENVRNLPKLCGKDGVWWEPKQKKE